MDAVREQYKREETSSCIIRTYGGLSKDVSYNHKVMYQQQSLLFHHIISGGRLITDLSG